MSPNAVINAYLTLSFLCALLNIAPTFSHLTQGHSGPGAFGIWVVLLNILGFVNGIIWRSDALNRAPVFCDISMRISMVGLLGLLMANMCIIRYLAIVLTPNRGLEGKGEKQRRMLIDYALCFGFPSLVAGSAIVYQAGRFGINRMIGCSNVSGLAWPSFILSIIWPPIICAISCGYSLYVMYWLFRRHRDLQQLVRGSNSPLNMSRFFRMGAFSVTYFCISVPSTIYGTMETISATGPYLPWKSWETIHNSWNKLSDIRQNPLYEYQLRDWLPIVAGLVLFVFFSFAGESTSIYRKLSHLLHIEQLLKPCQLVPRVSLPGCTSGKSFIRGFNFHSTQCTLSEEASQEFTENPCKGPYIPSKRVSHPVTAPPSKEEGLTGISISIVRALSTT